MHSTKWTTFLQLCSGWLVLLHGFVAVRWSNYLKIWLRITVDNRCKYLILTKLKYMHDVLSPTVPTNTCWYLPYFVTLVHYYFSWITSSTYFCLENERLLLPGILNIRIHRPEQNDRFVCHLATYYSACRRSHSSSLRGLNFLFFCFHFVYSSPTFVTSAVLSSIITI